MEEVISFLLHSNFLCYSRKKEDSSGQMDMTSVVYRFWQQFQTTVLAFNMFKGGQKLVKHQCSIFGIMLTERQDFSCKPTK